MPDCPLIDVAVVIGTQSFLGEALPDTGYDGSVIVPIDVGDEVLDSSNRRRLRMADNHPVTVDSWEGQLLVEDRVFDTSVSAFGDQFIIGREMLDEMEICFEFGTRVRIRFQE